MESINEVISKKDSFHFMWELLAPQGDFNNQAMWNSCRNYWNALSIQRQRQIYYTIREQKKHGEHVKDNPLFALQDCTPVPTNWNGRPGVNEMMKTTKMVIAKYKASSKYGTYTLAEAKLFEMTDVKPLN